MRVPPSLLSWRRQEGLLCIDKFPERLHHPKESDLLFPRVVRALPSVMAVVQRHESDHKNGEKAVRELQHLLLAWELLGEPRNGCRRSQGSLFEFKENSDFALA